jgi:hypothetical protein
MSTCDGRRELNRTNKWKAQVRNSLMSGGRRRVDEMPEPLFAKDRQRGRDAVQNTFDVDVDHLLPLLDAEVVEGRDRPDAGIVDENIKLAVPVTCQRHEVGEVVAPSHVCARIGGFAARGRDAGRQSPEAIRSARPQNHLRAALSEQKRCRRAYTAACARDYDDLAFGSWHEGLLPGSCVVEDANEE